MYKEKIAKKIIEERLEFYNTMTNSDILRSEYGTIVALSNMAFELGYLTPNEKKGILSQATEILENKTKKYE